MLNAKISTINRFSRLEAGLPRDAVEISGRKLIDNQYKRIVVNIDPKKHKTVELIHITDIQWGSIACKEQRVVEFRDWILDSPSRFVLLGGDMIDAATVLSVASPYENKYQPSEQVYRFCEVWAPARGRIIGAVGGNHEDRTARGFGDAGELIANLLKIPYSRGKQLIDIHYGEHKPFKIDIWHGSGSARTKGAKAQALDRFMHQGDSQLYLMGHLHDVVLLFNWRQKRIKDDISLEKIVGVMSSSFLDYWGTYAERAGLPPSDTSMARCILEPSGKWEVTLR